MSCIFPLSWGGASDLNIVLRCVGKGLQAYERIGIGMFWEAESDRNPNAVITII